VTSDGSAFGGLVPPLKIPPGVDAATALSLFGVTGLTAYFGLLDVGAPTAGETLVVSAAAWAGEKTIKNHIDVIEGLENAPDALRRLFTGENLGKQLVKIADE
jgi:NADPH-dependent curcumin reductase CurA